MAHWQVRFFGPRPTSRPAGPGDLVLVASEVSPVFHDLRNNVSREAPTAAKNCREHGPVSPRVGRKTAGGVHGLHVLDDLPFGRADNVGLVQKFKELCNCGFVDGRARTQEGRQNGVVGDPSAELDGFEERRHTI